MTNIFYIIGTSFDNLTAHFITSTAARIITDFTPIAITGIGLFLTYYGYLIMGGRIDEPFSDFLFRCIKIIVIAAFALNSPTYLNWVVGAINGLQEGLISTLGQTNKVFTIYQNLDQTLNKGFYVINTCVEYARNTGWMHIGTIINWYINAGLIAAGTFTLVLTGGFIILMASVLLKIMLAVGPIFIMCLLWPITANFFGRWFSQTIAYVFKIVLAAVVMTFAIRIFEKIIGAFDMNSAKNTVQLALEILATSFILYKIMMEVGRLASSLAEGVSMNVAQLTSPGAGIRNLINPVSKRRNLQSGSLEVNSRFGHIISGNTLINPLYRQKLMHDLSKNWGKRREAMENE